MELISYETIKEKINNYCENKLYIELYIKEQKEKEKILCEVFNNKSISERIDTFRVLRLDNITILEYKTINKSNNRVKNNIVVISKDNEILKVEHYGQDKNFMYNEDKISTYDGNKRLINQVYIENICCVIRVEVLNAIKQIDRYNKKDYTFYNDDKETICLRVNREMYFKIENGFTSALNTATNLISKTCTKISDKLDEILGLEIVKEYKINRKRQGQ